MTTTAPGPAGTTPVVTAPLAAGPTLADTAPTVLALIAGYVGHRTVAIGLRAGLLERLAEHPGATADELADALALDPSYVSVWCRAALGAGVVERSGPGFRLAPNMATLLLDAGSPAYVGGVFGVLEAHEVFGRFEQVLASGERMWWEDTSPEWIAAVSGTGTPFYTRLVPGGLERVPGLAAELDAGCRVADTACGAGVGLVRMATTYPRCTFVGVDGDRHSLDLARARVDAAGLGDRVQLVHSALEDMELDPPARVVVNNISMHECRDIDRVAQNVVAALEPGGWFVISDFPFPDTDEGLRTVPGRIMSGIQFFEAQIDDQLLPRSAYDDLLTRHGFTDLGSVQLTPMHALTHGRRP
ncbi:methyltransferase domain-containing protein [Blastococcus sp. KM273128]|uniref:methyltransferase domain-containing protein n=1 Tax=Blastococcus sp. KM273128 TaxID=2570314 RepID=UPI001F209BB2|nr:methyltransferase domain-containing protein [Blastococcus sp. KM273128]MCF6745546.1 methyltransferase domain-containing protein [Blastococcus sp. KM273128]